MTDEHKINDDEPVRVRMTTGFHFNPSHDPQAELANEFIEKCYRNMAIDRRDKSHASKAKTGALGQTDEARAIAKQSVDAIAASIIEIVEAEANKRGQKKDWYKHLSYVPADALADIAFSACFNAVGAGWTVIQTHNFIGKVVNDLILHTVLEKKPQGLNLLRNINRRVKRGYGSPRALTEESIKLASEAQKKAFKDEDNNRTVFIDDQLAYTWSEWDFHLIDQVASLLITCVMKSVPYFVIEGREQEDGELIGGKYKKKPNYILLSEKGAEKWAELLLHFDDRAPQYGIMFVPPSPWGRETTGPYRDYVLRRRTSLVKNTTANQTKVLNSAMESGKLDSVESAVNQLQKVPYQLNFYVVEAVNWVAENKLNHFFAKFPVVEDVPVQPKMSKEAFAKLSGLERWEFGEFRRADIAANDAAKGNRTNLATLKTQTDLIWDCMEEFEVPKFYMPHQLDYRGRVYPMNDFGHHNADYMRGMFLFANEVLVNKKNVVWFCLQLANTYANSKDEHGRKLDKQDYESRQRWAIENEDKILLLGQDFTNPEVFEFWSNAESPFQFLSACRELYLCREANNRGDDYYTGLPIGIDATNSAIQIYASILRNKKDGGHVNLYKQDFPGDIYTVVRDEVERLVKLDKSNLESMDLEPAKNDDKETLEQKLKDKEKLKNVNLWLNHGITRSTVKQNAMTWSYSATLEGFQKQLKKAVMDDYTRQFNQGQIAEHPFGKDRGMSAVRYLASVNLTAIKNIIGSGKDGMNFIRSVASLCISNGLQFSYTTPLGFPVLQDEWHPNGYKRPDMYYWKVETDDDGNQVGSYGMTKSTRLTYSDRVNGPETLRQCCPNFIHSLDATVLMKSVNACADKGITDLMVVHDSFSTTLDNVKEMRDIVAEEFVSTFRDYCPFEDLLNQTIERLKENNKTIPDELPQVPLKGFLDIEAIKDSPYFLT